MQILYSSTIEMITGPNKWGMCLWEECVMTQMMPLFAYNFIEGHHSKMVKVTLHKFILELSFVFGSLWVRPNSVREQKRKI